MEVLPDTINEQIPQILRRVLDLFLCRVRSHHVVDLFKVLLLNEQVRYLACVQNVIDIFKEGLVSDLDVGENEG
jgi:hypothetical protein